MALDRVYTVLPDGPMVWAQHRPDSPIAALARPLAIEGDDASAAESRAVTLRIRYRGDVGINTLLRDSDGATWIVVQTHEFKRNRWLDINIATYRQPATADVIPPPVDAVAPAGWQYAVDGRPWLCLEVDTVHAVNAQDRRGTFAIPEGLRGWIEYAHRADVWYYRLRGTAELGCFELIQYDNIRQGFLRRRFFSHEDRTLVPNSTVPIGAGDVLELLTGAEAA